MKKRILSALLALAMVSTCLVGCGGNKSSESKSSGKVTKITIAVPDPEASYILFIRLRQNLQIVRKNILIIHWSLPFRETDHYMEEIQQLVLNSFRQVLYRC